jgi:hypothetical protein
MADLVKELVDDGTDLSDLEDYGTTTCQVAMKLVVILVEMKALLGLVSGRLRACSRENGHLAIWGKLPDWLRKLYCIDMVHNHKRTSRVGDFLFAENYQYLVRSD